MKKKKGKKREKKTARKAAGKKRLKKKVKRIRRKAKVTLVNVLYRAFFKSCYLVGLSFLIPFILTYTMPIESGESRYTVPITLFFIALFLVMFSFYGLLWRHKHLGKTFKSIGFMSLVPGLLAAFVYTIGRQRLIEAVLSLHAESPAVLLDLYITRTMPKLKVLVFVYIILGLFFYWIGTKVGE